MKKIIKITGILACIAILFVNVSLNHKSGAGDTDLSNLVVVNEASAECMPFFVAGGKCLRMNDYCVFAVEYTECDPYQ